jgi:predicted nucleic acid-binding protein
MNRVFVDANAWMAIANKRDRLHESALILNKRLLQSGYQYVTTNYVLDETYTGLLMHVGHFAAVDFGERIRKARVIEVTHISEGIEEEAWELFKRYSDKSFSFTDCTSFAVMWRFNLTEAFTNDHHFEQAGFLALLH